MKKRKAIPLSVKLAVALRQLAAAMDCDSPAELQLDHDPALAFRPMNAAGTDTVPQANSPEHLKWMPKPAHKTKTCGPGGEKRIHTRGSDIAEPRRLDRLSAAHTEFRARLMERPAKEDRPRSAWPKRKFNQRRPA